MVGTQFMDIQLFYLAFKKEIHPHQAFLPSPMLMMRSSNSSIVSPVGARWIPSLKAALAGMTWPKCSAPDRGKTARGEESPKKIRNQWQ